MIEIWFKGFMEVNFFGHLCTPMGCMYPIWDCEDYQIE